MDYPANAYKNNLITHLQTSLSTLIDSDMVRASLDCSGEDPRGTKGVVVSSKDLGSKYGTRNLVDVGFTISVYSHLDEDDDATDFDTILEAVAGAINQWRPTVTGWICHFVTPFTATSPMMVDSVLRSVEFDFQAYLEQAVTATN